MVCLLFNSMNTKFLCISILSGLVLFGNMVLPCSKAKATRVSVIASSGEVTNDNMQQKSLDAAYKFLYYQMDLYHSATIVAGDQEYQAYYPSGLMGDIRALSIDHTSSTKPHSGRSSIKITYDPSKQSANGWAGLYFQYPDGNWGEYPGRNLSGATKLAFWVRAAQPTVAEFLAGGINRPPRAEHEYSDSFGPLTSGPIKITQEWQRHEIPLIGEDLSSVIGSFAIVFSIAHTGEPRAVYIDDVTIDADRLEAPRFVQSYVASGCETGAAFNVSHVYDQSLVLLAFLARGTPEDLKRAGLIAKAMVQAQANDRTFTDGRLRNAYASGEVLDSKCGCARLPGQWNPYVQQFWEDEFAVGTDTGNMAWAGIALVQADALLPKTIGDPYLQAALKLANWIVKNERAEDSLGGFRGGFEAFEASAGNPSGQHVSNWRSTEHNIDLVALFEHLAVAVGTRSPESQFWQSQAEHARMFVEALQNTGSSGMQLLTGTAPESTVANTAVIPVDVQAWSVLGLGQPRKYEPALNWAISHCRAGNISNAFDFNCSDGDGAWWEGTAQVAAALRWLGRDAEANLLLERLRGAQLSTGPAIGGIPAASKCGLTTGFRKYWWTSGNELPWLYSSNPHIGATAWYTFAALGVNPYYLGARNRDDR